MDNKKKKIAVIGAGPSGITASLGLACAGYNVVLFDKREKTGGCLIDEWTIPDRKYKPEEISQNLKRKLKKRSDIRLRMETSVLKVEEKTEHVVVYFSSHAEQAFEEFDAVLIATGFIFAEKSLKKNALTFSQFEKMSKGDQSIFEKKPLTVVVCSSFLDKKAPLVNQVALKYSRLLLSRFPDTRIVLTTCSCFQDDEGELKTNENFKWLVGPVESMETAGSKCVVSGADIVMNRQFEIEADLVVFPDDFVPSEVTVEGNESINESDIFSVSRIVTTAQSCPLGFEEIVNAALSAAGRLILSIPQDTEVS